MLKSKKFLIPILIIVILLIGCAVYYFLVFKSSGPTPSKEKTPEEILNDLTAPGGNEQIPKEVMENLNAPEQSPSENLADEILNNLTAPK